MQSVGISRQVQDTVSALSELFEDALLGIYLHGSAVQSRLQPQSDVDILVVVAGPVTERQRRALVTALLRLSGRHPRREPEPRCLEVMVFDFNGQGMHLYPAQAEIVYGEWLRDAFETGETAGPASDPENTIVLAQARENAIPLFGPEAVELLPEVSAGAIRAAMREGLPALLDGLQGDERNVLLTLARMWRTSEHGDFVSKDAAAAWARPRLPGRHALILDHARRAYLGEIVDTWTDRQAAARSAAEHMRGQIALLL
ncbi:aminoglycoside adenylyltransferase domain-containing protein [Rhizobium sp. GN54]|uniref:aminoglycoside adenylyltransferase domain-containing protein n=1 Tax=Rhizobium sp. GN54 TaxID=2898150 RepID=UPI001E572F3C|nr:aminoglycoside adenylyltransferase domain-containing protein [Rhizobium sp. GN54]MCD2180963.1 DUF4111 domain-containing protein [Rhizobium sp. GN54]